MSDNKAGTLTPASSQNKMNELARNLKRCTPNIQKSRSQRGTLGVIQLSAIQSLAIHGRALLVKCAMQFR